MTAAPSPRARRTTRAASAKPLTTADAPARNLTEAQFQAQVVELARRLGWRTYHTHDSRRSDPGFPDLVMLRDRRIVYAELKSNRGRLRPEQRDWLAALTAAGQEAYLWFPVSWQRIESVLR